MAEALLVIREGSDAGREIPLTGDLTIGRSEEADVRLDDPGISRTHARIRPEGIGAVIEDLGSSNGTFVNGERVETPLRLRDGDEVQLGAAIVSFAGGSDETQQIGEADPDATEAHPPPAPAPEEPAAIAESPAPPPSAPPPSREPIRPPQPGPARVRDEVNDWNLAALAAIVLGPASLLMIAFGSGSTFYAALPVALAAVALGTVGRNKVDRGESSRFRSAASAGRSLGIAGAIAAAIILAAVIALDQVLDANAESLSELIEEIRSEIEGG